MGELRKSKSVKIVWSKADIAQILGSNYGELKCLMPEPLKKEVGWEKGLGKFRDVEALKVIRYFRGTLNEEELRGLLYPGGRF